jgi:hypothetical protein
MAEDAAREIPNLPLEDALQLAYLYADRGSPSQQKRRPRPPCRRRGTGFERPRSGLVDAIREFADLELSAAPADASIAGVDEHLAARSICDLVRRSPGFRLRAVLGTRLAGDTEGNAPAAVTSQHVYDDSWHRADMPGFALNRYAIQQSRGTAVRRCLSLHSVGCGKRCEVSRVGIFCPPPRPTHRYQYYLSSQSRYPLPPTP